MSNAELILVRHGETVGESTIRLNGSTDVGLSDHGRRQMERVRDALTEAGRAKSFDRLYVSPLSRSISSAAIVHPSPSPAPTIVDAFTEIDFGVWEGMTAAEVRPRDPRQFEAWKRGKKNQ